MTMFWFPFFSSLSQTSFSEVLYWFKRMFRYETRRIQPVISSGLFKLQGSSDETFNTIDHGSLRWFCVDTEA